jgi:hypothetical protein
MKNNILLGLSVILLVFVAISPLASPSEYRLKKASELIVGDVIVSQDGEEVIVERIEHEGKSQNNLVSKDSKPLRMIIWEKIIGKGLPEKTSVTGSTNVILSLGEAGVGVAGMVVSNSTEDVQKKSFWRGLFFWRKNE